MLTPLYLRMISSQTARVSKLENKSQQGKVQQHKAGDSPRKSDTTTIAHGIAKNLAGENGISSEDSTKFLIVLSKKHQQREVPYVPSRLDSWED